MWSSPHNHQNASTQLAKLKFDGRMMYSGVDRVGGQNTKYWRCCNAPSGHLLTARVVWMAGAMERRFLHATLPPFMAPVAKGLLHGELQHCKYLRVLTSLLPLIGKMLGLMEVERAKLLLTGLNPQATMQGAIFLAAACQNSHSHHNETRFQGV